MLITKKMDYNFFGDDGPSDNEQGFNPFDDEEYDERVIDTGPVFEPEIGAFERTGMGGRLGTVLVGGLIGDLQKKMMRELSSEDRFKIYVDAISRKLSSDETVHISNSDIDVMLDKVPAINGVQYKNPTAYILGFLATRGGRGMDNVSNIIKNVLPAIGDVGVEAPDVVRYARYWVMHLK